VCKQGGKGVACRAESPYSRYHPSLCLFVQGVGLCSIGGMYASGETKALEAEAGLRVRLV